MAASLLAVSSLLPSQSIFNEIQSIHETGFFHEIQSIGEIEALPSGKVMIGADLPLDLILTVLHYSNISTAVTH